MSSRIW